MASAQYLVNNPDSARIDQVASRTVCILLSATPFC